MHGAEPSRGRGRGPKACGRPLYLVPASCPWAARPPPSFFGVSQDFTFCVGTFYASNFTVRQKFD
eukprot:4926194-Prymnesium_polylepis.1